MYFLDAHLDFLPDNCGAINNEHGERFHHYIIIYQQCRKNIRESAILPCFPTTDSWTPIKEGPEAIHKRIPNKQRIKLL